MVSGLLLLKLPWPAIFWFSAIASSGALLAVSLCVPETCRAIVGNGSIPMSSWNTPVVPLLRPRAPHGAEAKREMRPTASIFNVFANLNLLRDPGTFCISLCFGIYYMIQTCTSASLSSMFVDTYGVSGLVAGLIYMPFGLGCMIASYLVGTSTVLVVNGIATARSLFRRSGYFSDPVIFVRAGQVVDRDYSITARKRGLAVDRARCDGLAGFPIERARFRSSQYFILVCVPLIVAYGWALELRVVSHSARVWNLLCKPD